MRLSTLKKQFTQAVKENNRVLIEEIYAKVDDYYHHLLHNDDEYTVSQTKLSNWESFHGEVCTVVVGIRKTNPQYS
jgi:hypothetical protein